MSLNPSIFFRGFITMLGLIFADISVTQAQKQLDLEVCENCLNDVFQETFKATKMALPPVAKDSTEFTITLPAKKNLKKALLYLSDADIIEVTDGSKIYYAGRFTPKSRLAGDYARYLIPIELGEVSRVLKVKLIQKDNQYFSIKPKLIIGSQIAEVKSLYLAQNEPARVVNLMSIILLTLLLIYSFYQAYLLKNETFKAYGFYLASVLLFLFIFSDEYLQWHILLPDKLHQYGAYNIFPQGLIYVLYTEFGMVFLDIKKRYPKLFKLSRLFQIITLSITGFHSAYLVFSGGDQAFIYKYILFLYAAVLILSNYLTYLVLFKVKDQTKWFLLVGSTVIGWAVGYEVFQIFAKGSPKPRDFFYALPSGYMHFSMVELSYVVESLIFLMGINYKNLRKEKENKALKERVILQLKEKENLEKEVNLLLKEKLKHSEEELATEQLSSEFERNKVQLLKSQLSSLQLQMNPHYLFNSLNSINDFIISKKPEEASEYLALYARMMRNILRNSDHTFHTLEHELQFCQDYLELESMRFEERFEYHIIRPKHDDLLQKKIPGMMLQPILENAVWHGMMPLKSNGNIRLDASESTNQHIIITIVDNGKGFNDTEEKQIKKESYGLSNIRDKIELLHKLYGKKIGFEIENKQQGGGVKATFTFPDIWNESQI